MANVVTDTILEQFGARRAAAMIGIKQIVTSQNAVDIRYAAKGRNGANHVRIELDPNDTYTVTFYKIAKGGMDVRRVKDLEMVYADVLRETFTRETGLHLSL